MVEKDEPITLQTAPHTPYNGTQIAKMIILTERLVMFMK